MRPTWGLLCWLGCSLGCAAPLTFRDAPVVWRELDDRDIPEPSEQAYNRYQHYGEIFFFGPISRALAVPEPRPSLDVNVLDEVPDSTWFENRLSRFELTPSDVGRGVDGPRPRPPLTVKKAKLDPVSPALRVVDADGKRFLIKLDPASEPERRSAAAAISSRLLWAAGYHVPSEHVVTFSRGEIALGAGATHDRGLDEDLPFGPRELDELLSGCAVSSGGQLRALASELLPGKPKGGFSDMGTRLDDPNDRIPHERRRSLRGLHVFAAWLDHSDLNPDNTLDTYLERDGRRFLVHHLVDFGETLGVHNPSHPSFGYAHLFDPEHALASLLSFGLWLRPWEREPAEHGALPAPLPGTLRPEAWRETKPFLPFRERTASDTFWAAKIVLRFTREHLEAAVAAGSLSDPEAARALVDVLWERRRAIGRAYLTGGTALDRFEVDRDRVCSVDLAVLHGLASGGVVERLVDGEVAERERIAASGRVCLKGPGETSYARYVLRVVRGSALDPIEVHVRGGAGARVLGVVRALE